MKISKILLVALVLSLAVGLNAHAVDAETLAKAKAWVAEQQAKAKVAGQVSGDDSEAQSKAEKEKQALETAAELKAQQEAAAKKQALEQAEAEQQAKAKKEAETAAEKQSLEPVHGSLATTLNYASVVDVGSYKGTTFFSLMERIIKPEMDRYATEGYRILNGAAVEAILSKVDKKVSRGAIQAAGSLARLKNIADRLSASGTRYTFHQLPAAIAQIDGSVGRYDLQEFFGLASGGGVAVRFMDGVYAYNVNYGTGLVQMDAQSGRSFGEAAGRLARDASDADYLQMLERYVRYSGGNIAQFYQSMLEILTNNDVSTFPKITDEGKIVASDFLAVYVAEQDRHLMVNLKSQHWDRALLEVTLLSALHAGQSEVMVMYNGKLTGTTYKQVRNCVVDPNAPAPMKIAKKAGMIDYWQFSANTTKPNCVRSGINLTNREFRKLGRLISDYERVAHPQLVRDVERHLKGIPLTGNLFADLSNFLISYKTPKSLDATTLQLPADFTRFLMQVRADANDITSAILQNQ